MKHTGKAFLACLCVAALMCSFACSQKHTATDASAGGAAVGAGDTDAAGTGEGDLEEADISARDFAEIDAGDAALSAVFKDIHFDYDDFSLRPGARTTLDGIAEWMMQNTSRQLLVEGHCDERGTNEYNLALGDRRANSAKKYLVQLGVAARRVSTISYGEERPLAPGSTEDAWAKNRRGHFKLK